MKKRLIVSLLALIIAILGGNALLTWLDPLGIVRYYSGLRRLQDDLIPFAGREFVAAPGRHQIGGWTYTIRLPDYTRVVPGISTRQCTIVALGDSVTFGLGVNDDEAWPALLARQTGCRVVNAGYPWYDVWAVLETRRAFPGADEYIYLLVDNDADHTAPDALIPLPDASAVRMYLQLLTQGQHEAGGAQGEATPPDDFWQALKALMAEGRVDIVGFKGTWLAEKVAEAGIPIHLIQPYTNRLSWADVHPDAAGHKEIADQILPFVKVN